MEAFPATPFAEEGLEEFRPGSDKGKSSKGGGFQSMGLSQAVFRSIMRKGYRVPTPIQRRAIPPLLNGSDVVAMARTGSGKTAAFLIPLFEKLKAHSTTVGIRAVVISPTRELALQTQKFCKELSHFISPPLRFCLLVGGDSVEDQFELLAANPDVLIATPGRMQHILLDAQLSLGRVEYVVFDEADRLFEMGFATQLHTILATMPSGRQTALFSATMPGLLADFTRAQLHEPQLIRLDTESKLSEHLTIEFFRVRPHEKMAALMLLLAKVLTDSKKQQTIVFASTRHHVELLNNLLLHAGHASACIYGSLDASARKIALAAFRAAKANILVVTDVAARGIDVPLLDNVINFDFPSRPKLFVHRAGRVARAGRAGLALSLVEPDEVAFLADVCLYLGRTLRLTPSAENGSTADAASSDDEGDGSMLELGSIPPTMLELESEYLESVLSARPDLAEMAHVATRATQMYRKTRGAASKASVSRARALPKAVGIHSRLASGLDMAAEGKRSSLLAELKTFRPGLSSVTGATAAAGGISARRQKRAATPDEPAGSDVRGGGSVTEVGGGATGLADAHADADADAGEPDGGKRRRASDREGGAKRKGEASTKKKKTTADDFRSEFYMSHTKPVDHETTDEAYLRVDSGDTPNRLQRAVMDLIEDEREGISKKRSVVRWDARKKKYVREFLGQV